MRPRSLALSVVLATAFPVLAANPPALVNYQGVLRDASDRPRNGSFDMVFRFFDAASAGSEILVDSHTGGGGNAVTVSSGLFSTQLGGGTVTDGSGAGTYTSLTDVFRDYGAVWMQIEVGGELLSPRVRVQSSPYALNASNLQGQAAASFLNTSSTAQTKTGALTLDTTAQSGLALNVSAQFQGGIVSSNNSYVYLANNDQGVKAGGSNYGGIFQNGGSGTYAYLGTSAYGVQGYGAGGTGGYFQDSAGDTAYAASGGFGVYATGSWYGAFFGNTCCSGGAYLGDFDYGIYAYGNAAGGYFSDSNNSGYAYLGDGDYGVYGYGSAAGGSFATSGAGQSYLAKGDYGITAYGQFPYGAAGYFKDSGYSGEAYLGDGDTGVLAYGNYRAAYFANVPAGLSVNLAFNDGYTKAAGIFDNGSVQTYLSSNVVSNSGLWTNGSKNFVQNHPDDPTRTIAYACVEGDEVGTYTRGSARLVGDEAHVRLSETFKWVTNPDVGLTAQLTPRGGFADLYIASLTTEEMVVRSRVPSAGGVEFDYQVNGLRIGFDDVPVTVPRSIDAPLPPRENVKAVYTEHPELAATSARARFLGMHGEGWAAASAVSSKAAELEAKIGFADPTAHRHAMEKEASSQPRPARPASRASQSGPTAVESRAATDAPPAGGPFSGHAIVPSVATAGQAPASPGLSATAVSVIRAGFPIGGPVEAGDLVAIDPLAGGSLRRSDRAGDPTVVGVALDGTQAPAGEAFVAVGGVASCKVDATHGPVAPGDLLVASSIPGHAMAMQAPPIGSVVGIALDALASGTGTVRVLVTPR